MQFPPISCHFIALRSKYSPVMQNFWTFLSSVNVPLLVSAWNLMYPLSQATQFLSQTRPKSNTVL
jgi:hypothetical protein